LNKIFHLKKKIWSIICHFAIQNTIDDDPSTTTQCKFQGALNRTDSSSSSITDKLQALLDIEVTKAREREDATRYAMETCRRKLERLIDDSTNQGSNMYVPTSRTSSKWNQLNSEKIGDEEYEKLRTVYETNTEVKLSKPDKIIDCISPNRKKRWWGKIQTHERFSKCYFFVLWPYLWWKLQ